MSDLIIESLDFTKGNGLIPAIIQDENTLTVLMLGYMNEQACRETLRQKRVVFWSRSRQQLWLKGETSGNYLQLVNMQQDCDNDCLLITARPLGPTCHQGTTSCFPLAPQTEINEFNHLYNTICERRDNPSTSSYTAKLCQAGLPKILAKVAEESSEVLLAANCQGRQRLIEESSDLLFHLMVLLSHEHVELKEIAAELFQRRR